MLQRQAFLEREAVAILAAPADRGDARRQSGNLEPERRTDRVIAEAWDAAFVLFDGIPTAEDVARLKIGVPRQEAARYRPTELVLSRANKSVRFFDHMVERLATGRRPDEELLRRVAGLIADARADRRESEVTICFEYAKRVLALMAPQDRAA